MTLLEDGGRPSVAVTPREGSTSPLVTRYRDGDMYVIPTTALSYLGRSLDPALFDVSRLVRAGCPPPRPHRGARRRQGPGPARPSGPPWSVRPPPTRRPRRQAGRSARPRAARATARCSAASPPCGSTRRRTPPRPRAPHPRRGPRRRHPHRHRSRRRARPSGKLSLANVDDSTQYDGADVEVTDGVAKASVPPGHYTAYGSFQDRDEDGLASATRVISVDFTVPEDGEAAEATIDLATADQRVTVRTPKDSATGSDTVLNYRRDDAKGEVALASSLGFVGTEHPIYVSPPPPRPASCTSTSSTTASPWPTPTSPTPTTSAGQRGRRHRRRPGVRGHRRPVGHVQGELPQRPGRPRRGGRAAAGPAVRDQPGRGVPRGHRPARRVEYVGGSADVTFVDAFKAVNLYLSHRHEVKFGTTGTVEWLRGPLAPGLTTPGTGTSEETNWYCKACRKGDDLTVLLSQIVDSDGNYPRMLQDLKDSHVVFSSGDEVLVDKHGVLGTILTVPADKADYKLAYDQERTGSTSYHQSLVTHSEWTFSSARPESRTVPEGWSCYTADGEPGDSEGAPAAAAHRALRTRRRSRRHQPGR
ncbi:hypothetical protein NKH77_54825 [Streptomyces sp. M19]